MESVTYKLYLIRIGYRTLSIVPSKDEFEAINKYIKRTGFVNNHKYFCCSLMVNTVVTKYTSFSKYNDCSIIRANTKTPDGNFLIIGSRWVKGCGDIFALVDPKDINNPLFVRPAINEVRNCVGFSDAPEYQLRKFCIWRECENQ